MKKFLMMPTRQTTQTLLQPLASDLSVSHWLHKPYRAVLPEVPLRLLPDRCAPNLEAYVLEFHTCWTLHKSLIFHCEAV